MRYARSPDQSAAPSRPAHHAVIVIGAGPVGLAAAIDLAVHGHTVVLLDESDTPSPGSRAVCYAKRTLEIFDRLGCGDAIAARGTAWSEGKVYLRDRLLYSFDWLPEPGHHRPAFINLQQSLLESILIERARTLEGVDLRWKNKVVRVEPSADSVRLTIDTPDGPYALTCDWLVVADGARSPVREALGLVSVGQAFTDHFLIVDATVRNLDAPAEQRFWFDPLFHPGHSALIERQAGEVWRLELQLGRDVEPARELEPARVLARVRAAFGVKAADVRVQAASVYTFQCRRMERFRHGRVLFAGDAAHQVSPFGARGANSGIQDADNLAWKLALVMRGAAPDRLLDSYDFERTRAADENIRDATRATDFISPRTPAERMLRDEVLDLAARYPFARSLVNGGRLSVPAMFPDSPLNTPDRDPFNGRMTPGSVVADAPVERDGRADWLIDQTGSGFRGVLFAPGDHFVIGDTPELEALARDPERPVTTLIVVPRDHTIHEVPAGCTVLVDRDSLAWRRFDAHPGTYYLLRPDQHVAARWREFRAERVRAALARATCHA